MGRDIARIPLAQLPTPIEELPRLSKALGGPRLLAKRDDLTGLAGGGNKTRKLEYLVADALQQGAATLITAGAVQSNHCRQTAAAAARQGLHCVLVLSPMAPATVQGNLLLDRLLGARVRWTGARSAYALMQEVADEERRAGRTPYVIPVGGSSAIGAAAYAVAMHEALAQLSERGIVADRMVVASGSGGTQAGLLAGARQAGYEGQVLGISVAQSSAALARDVQRIAELTVAHLGYQAAPAPEQVLVNDGYLGEGYGVLGDPEREAIQLVARTEGLLLDPVYTARAMAALIDMVRRGSIGKHETVLFWHTGGSQALDAYAAELLGSRCNATPVAGGDRWHC